MLSAQNCKLSPRTKLGIKTVKIKRRQSSNANLKMTIWQRQLKNGANMTVFKPWQKKNGDTVDSGVVSIQVQPRKGWVFGRVWKLFCIHNLCALSVKRYFVLLSRRGSDAVQRLLIVCQGKIGPGPPLVSITVFANMAFSQTSTPLFSCPGQLNNWHCLSVGAN